MTFLLQVQGLTGLTISSSGTTPTQDELSQFLKDGVVEIVQRIIKLKPEEAFKFSATTNSTSSVAKVGQVLSVVREHDSQTILRPCSPISPQDRYEAANSNSLKYRTKYNPGYYELNGSIFCIPAAGTGDNDIVVTQVTYDTGLAHGDSESAIDNFPAEYGYLVALYAAIKSLEANMVEYTITEEDYELATSIKLNIDELQTQYNSAFGSVAPPPQAQPQGR